MAAREQETRTTWSQGMVFVSRKPGEALIVETSSGRVVVQVLGADQYGIELPAGARVSPSSRVEQAGQWLPDRPARPTKRAS
jgi:hypothetical protein